MAHTSPHPCPSRRNLLAAALGIPAGALLVTSCSSPNTKETPTPSDAAPVTIPAADVPVGGAIITDVGAKKVAVSQPSQGQYKAYVATCTHQGAALTAGKDTTLTCPLHGSTFDSATGAATRGPAKTALTAATVTLTGDQLNITL